MAVLNEVVTALFAAGVARNAIGLAQLRKTRLAACENFVHVSLVAGIPQHHVVWAFEHAVQGNAQFNGAQVGTQVATRFGNGIHNEVANFG